ncbi:hypothetical protein QE152_g22576 [Popillia japonica]|uniref:Uncharacterized protein n=1 Tax=Popillia japonica TaxID=7064 RepID=A0AAW1KI63_POPJA
MCSSCVYKRGFLTLQVFHIAAAPVSSSNHTIEKVYSFAGPAPYLVSFVYCFNRNARRATCSVQYRSAIRVARWYWNDARGDDKVMMLSTVGGDLKLPRMPECFCEVLRYGSTILDAL